MNIVSFNNLKFVGISVKTNNRGGNGSLEIPELWSKFMLEGWAQKIINKANDTIVAIYHGYKTNWDGDYIASICYEVTSFDNVPEGAIKIECPAAKYQRHIVKGNLSSGVVFQKWQEIWKEDDSSRLYQYDLEMYNPTKTADMTNAEVELYIGIKN